MRASRLARAAAEERARAIVDEGGSLDPDADVSLYANDEEEEAHGSGGGGDSAPPFPDGSDCDERLLLFAYHSLIPPPPPPQLHEPPAYVLGARRRLSIPLAAQQIDGAAARAHLLALAGSTPTPMEATAIELSAQQQQQQAAAAHAREGGGDVASSGRSPGRRVPPPPARRPPSAPPSARNTAAAGAAAAPHQTARSGTVPPLSAGGRAGLASAGAGSMGGGQLDQLTGRSAGGDPIGWESPPSPPGGRALSRVSDGLMGGGGASSPGL